MRLSSCALVLLTALSLPACDSATDGSPRAALTARYNGEVTREGPTAPLPEALALTDLLRLPVSAGAAGFAEPNADLIVFLEERRDGSMRVLPAGYRLADPDRVGLFAFAPAAFLERAEFKVFFADGRNGPASTDSLALRAGAGLIGDAKATRLSLAALTPRQSLGAVVRGVERSAARVSPLLVARYRPGDGCLPVAGVTALVRNPTREPLYETPADTTALGACLLPTAPALTVLPAAEGVLVLLPGAAAPDTSLGAL